MVPHIDNLDLSISQNLNIFHDEIFRKFKNHHQAFYRNDDFYQGIVKLSMK
jgi:hypothetical protein